jgi:PAS domain S-box-containing protein
MFDQIVNTLSHGIYVVQDDRLLYLNRRCGHFFGYPEIDGLIGQNFFDAVYPDNKTSEFFKAVHDKLLVNEEPQISWAQMSTRTDGVPIWLEVFARRISVDGRPAIFGLLNDQTECQLIANAMLISQETLRLVLDAMEDRVYVVTDDYRIVYANSKMREGIAGAIDSGLCYQLCRGLSEPCPDCSRDAVFECPAPVHKEYFNERSQAWFSVIEMAIRMPGVTRPAKLAVARDITFRKEAEKEIRALSHRLLSAQENERKHLSRELHDDVGQRLNALKIGMETLCQDLDTAGTDLQPRLDNLTNVLQQSIDAVRELSAGLRPTTLEQLGLVETIRSHCRKIALVNGLPIEFRTAGMNKLKLDSAVEIILFRVVQEGLNNIIKHAGASRVTIRLTASYPKVCLRIEDDGQGFDLLRRRSNGQQLGLVGMAERAEQLSGTLNIRTQPGKGTCLLFEVPLAAQVRDKE